MLGTTPHCPPNQPSTIFAAARAPDAAPLHALLSSLPPADARALATARSDTGFLPLHLAASAGSSPSVRLLLAHGAPPAPRDSESWSTPLHCALLRGNLGAALALLAAGAPAEDGEEGWAARRAGASAEAWLAKPLAPPSERAAAQGGGCRDKPGMEPDHYHTCYALSGLSVAGGGGGQPGVAAVDPVCNLRPERVAAAREYYGALPVH